MSKSENMTKKRANCGLPLKYVKSVNKKHANQTYPHPICVQSY